MKQLMPEVGDKEVLQLDGKKVEFTVTHVEEDENGYITVKETGRVIL